MPPLKLFTLVFRDVDWFGWGDWLYFVISIASVFQSFLQTYIGGDDDVVAPYYLSGTKKSDILRSPIFSSIMLVSSQ
jgi:hypothetical protein